MKGRCRVYGLILTAFIALAASASISATAPLNKSLMTTFTASVHCFTGFSTKNVTNCVQLRPDELFTDAEGANPVGFEFYPDDPIISANPSEAPGVYISDMFYAYCQSFSRTPLTVTLTASDYMTCLDTPVNEKNRNIEYELVYLPSMNKGDGKSKDWNGTKSITISEPAGEYTQPRVVMSQPIMLKVYSKLVRNGQVRHEVETDKRYQVTFTLKVSTVE